MYISSVKNNIMLKKIFCSALIILTLWSCKDENDENNNSTPYNESSKVLNTIAFGSCATQLDAFATQTVPDRKIFSTIASKNPDLYIAGGDNLYLDLIAVAPGTHEYMLKGYGLMFNDPDFNNLIENVDHVATWDDHDYGQNDGVFNNPVKEYAKYLFLKYWEIPEESPRHSRDGIYDVYYYGPEDKRVQVILLDLRTFQSAKGTLPLAALNGYQKITDPNKTMMGSEQWAWLKDELKKPAKLRLIVSSVQFASEYNKFEAWSVFPLEQQKMVDLIKETRAEGVVFLSGDVHYADLNKYTQEGIYPLYDLTSSGLTHKEGSAYASANRVMDPYVDLNFGLIKMDWAAGKLTYEVYDKPGEKQREFSIMLSDLKF
jgi:alkaline phosphatase D